MGFSSFVTSDTKRSIPNAHSDRDPFPVYLLQPDGKPPIREDSYDGYGVFGGIDVHEWLGRMNAPLLGLTVDDASTETLRSLGITLFYGDYLVDDKGNRYALSFNTEETEMLSILGIKPFPGTYADPLHDNDPRSVNDLIATGELKIRPMITLLSSLWVHHPIKLVENPKLQYADVPASEECPDQGYFYD